MIFADLMRCLPQTEAVLPGGFVVIWGTGLA